MASGFLKDYEKDWQDIRDKGLLLGITTPEEYERRYAANLVRVEEALANQPTFITDQHTIKRLHGLLFEGITPYAGHRKARSALEAHAGFCLKVEVACERKSLIDCFSRPGTRTFNHPRV
jgi:fido (protein-threonine AMPylation protein)